ncbi:beta-lactamase class D OXA-42 [Enhydrobacter aerosaccus]|uniref:Beta-lactamase n=1 Tax=Enhydrobacter aerosaccus TaxID=225324 RepID=A0A1T4KUA8_9HYPH|nr:class D beta-lactamase [Enhydrobacter aerosaccus]SJZ46032.1 beta-lactamase class D OXA-42 [Enhydrobacter aerosaccus]
MYLRHVAFGLLATILAVPSAQARTICTAIADAGTGKILRQQGDCTQRATPASTFKIAISLMGYDSGFLQDEHTPALAFHKGYADWIPAWRQTTDPTSWIRNSVVWFSQQVTQALGETRFQNYVSAFHYGNEDVSGDPGKHNGLTRSWLSSSLKISPLEQLAFLEDVKRGQLPLSPHAFEMTDRITKVADLQDGWEVHGKTGSGAPVARDGTRDEAHSYGWFVGWATRGTHNIVFARLIQDEKKESESGGIRARAAFMEELPAILRSLPQ